jgi:hypothetical protein
LQSILNGLQLAHLGANVPQGGGFGEGNRWSVVNFASLPPAICRPANQNSPYTVSHNKPVISDNGELSGE